MSNSRDAPDEWPALPYEEWKETCDTLHLWSQVVGKVKLALNTPENHWWHVAFALTARGLTTGPVPYRGRIFAVEFDFLDHNLRILSSEGGAKAVPLVARSVARFYREFMECLRALGIEVAINTLPSEVKDPIPCDQDEEHASYDPEYAGRFWRILVRTASVLKRHRSRFVGKASPVHFFWGSFDLALSFFSGRRAPERPQADRMTREGYSHEVISCGFWPGNEAFSTPAFYAYTAPEPPGFARAAVLPSDAFYSKQFGEFLLRYADMRAADRPDQALFDFCQSTYEAGASLGNWDRESLERPVRGLARSG
ncbi:MAG TPA: DUF5996 family protein [Spirochaetia bacterium]|nr:DUF5996 family protein [Spirochaetia bacterium]